MKRCQNCGTENAHDGAFCRNCGTRLPEARPASEPQGPTAAAGETTGKPGPLPPAGRCSECGASGSPETNFCRSCGARMPRAATPTPVSRAGTQDDEIGKGPTEPKPVAGVAPRRVPDVVKCPRCGSQAPGGHMFCPGCGAQLPTLSGAPTPDEVRRVTAGREQYRPSEVGYAPTADGTKKSPLVRSGANPAPSQGESWGRLVSVNRDGSDGPGYYLTGGFADVGSGVVQIRLEDDPHVAARHARFERNGKAVQVVPLDEVNGVMWRLTEPTEVLDGAIVLLGRELCEIDVLSEEESETNQLRQHGVAMFASPIRKPWARLRQILASGAVGDVRHFYGDEVIVGREEGDIVFADDEFMSRRHAVFRIDKGRCILEDLDSSNGTFVRLDGATLVSDGDYLRLGDHMFRFEAIP